MSMAPFYTRFRDLAIRETRSATVHDDPVIPDGEYGFIELYCDEVNCDCRRVILNVISATTGNKVWATINYGWEDVEYYEKWTRNKELAQDMVGAALDPLNIQTRYAPALLELFEYIIEDPSYVKRLQRHYEMFKADIRKEARLGDESRKRRRRSRSVKK